MELKTRNFKSFRHKEAEFRIRTTKFAACIQAIKTYRQTLDTLIAQHPAFKTSLAPIPPLPSMPEFVSRMYQASQAVGVGPMATVAGTFAEFAARAAITAGAQEAIVENGGDIYIISPREIVLGIYAGNSPLSGKLAFRIPPEMSPLAVCSSSSNMGHSLSLGKSDLATVFSENGSLADAAATQAANLVQTQDDIERVLNRILDIPGTTGILIIKDDRIGIKGNVPDLLRNSDPALAEKITRHRDSVLPQVII